MWNDGLESLRSGGIGPSDGDHRNFAEILRWVQAGDDSVPEELCDVTEATKSEKGRSNFDVHDVL